MLIIIISTARGQGVGSTHRDTTITTLEDHWSLMGAEETHNPTLGDPHLKEGDPRLLVLPDMTREVHQSSLRRSEQIDWRQDSASCAGKLAISAGIVPVNER